MRLYKILFVSIYRIMSAIEKETPVISSILILSLTVLFNILEIVIIIDILGLKIVDSLNKMYAIPVMLLFILFNLIYLFKKKRYLKISEEFSNIKIKYGWIYILISIVLLFVLAPLRVALGS